MSVYGDIIEALFKRISDDMIKTDDYPLKIASVSRYDQNIFANKIYTLPMIMIADGTEVQRMVDGSGTVRNTTDLFLRGFLKTKTAQDTKGQVGAMAAAIYQFLDQDLAGLATGFRNLYPVGQPFMRYSEDQTSGDVAVSCRLIYITSSASY